MLWRQSGRRAAAAFALPSHYVRRLFTAFGGPATAFPHVKFQQKMAYSLGK